MTLALDDMEFSAFDSLSLYVGPLRSLTPFIFVYLIIVWSIVTQATNDNSWKKIEITYSLFFSYFLSHRKACGIFGPPPGMEP